MTEQILELAAALGGAGEEERPVLERLCRAAERERAGRLRPGTGPEDWGDAFPVAAAWLALAGLETGRQAGGVESFSAGDLKLALNGGGRRAEELRRGAERLMAPYLTDGGFAFQGVRG